jgi:hypothetical protein
VVLKAVSVMERLRIISSSGGLWVRDFLAAVVAVVEGAPALVGQN